MSEAESLLPKHGGYKNLLSYQLAELVFDITVVFCEKYVPVRDRTHDQMVQSGRSGFQNIAEGSVDSGVSKKSEIKLTGIAIGCMDELTKDYQKYLLTRKQLAALEQKFLAEGGISERMYRLRKEARERAEREAAGTREAMGTRTDKDRR